MAKKKKESKEAEILGHFDRNLNDFMLYGQRQRDEILRSFLYLAGYEYRMPEESRAKRKRKANISMLPAVVRAVAGSDIMKERHIDAVPIDDDFNPEVDIMEDVLDYVQYASGARSARGRAATDCAACGIGATVKFLDMTKREVASGTPTTRRIYPGFIFFDNSGHGGDLNETGNFCGYVDPMRSDDLEKYIEECLGDRNEKYSVEVSRAGAGYFTSEFLRGLRTEDARLDLLYHYFWREYIDVWDVQNPFIEEENPVAILVMQDAVAAEFMAGFASDTAVDLSSPYWTLDKEQKAELDKTLAALARMGEIDIALDESKRKVYCYYRAEIARGQLLKWSKSYSQTCYPLNIMTGYFDEALGIYYGFIRQLSPVQDALNDVTDDLLDYSRSASTGGKVYIKGMAEDVARIKRSKANEDDVTPIPLDGEVIPKELASTPQVLLETVRLLLELLPRAIGIGQEFLGVITSGDMTDSLYGKVVRQSFAVLEEFSNASAGYSKREGILSIDLMMSVAKAEDGRILPILSPGHDKQAYFRLQQQNMARHYQIRVVERPITEDERSENLKILTQLMPTMAQLGINPLPVMIKNLNMDMSDKKELMELVTPKPAEPNPLDMASAQANIQLLTSQANKLNADAQSIMAKLSREDDKIASEVDKNVAQAQKYLADAGKTMREPAKGATNG